VLRKSNFTLSFIYFIHLCKNFEKINQISALSTQMGSGPHAHRLEMIAQRPRAAPELRSGGSGVNQGRIHSRASPGGAGSLRCRSSLTGSDSCKKLQSFYTRHRTRLRKKLRGI
jgi:hypothetical protein